LKHQERFVSIILWWHVIRKNRKFLLLVHLYGEVEFLLSKNQKRNF